MSKDPSWHSEQQAKMKSVSDVSLHYIAMDCYEAAKAAQSLGNSEAEGRYLDTMHYAHMELQSRKKARENTK